MADSKYDSIIDLPHRQSVKRPQMSLIDRAAQFAPFAALTGYDDAIDETGRLTKDRVELSEDMLDKLNLKLRLIADSLGEDNEVVITYFEPDKKKNGGAYVAARGIVRKIDEFQRLIVLRGGREITMDDVYSIDGEWLRIISGEDII